MGGLGWSGLVLEVDVFIGRPESMPRALARSSWRASADNLCFVAAVSAVSPSVIDTDYTSYAVVYFCEQKFFDLFKTELLWILTRERIPSQVVIDKATSIIKAQGIDTKRLKKTRQTNCPA